MSEIDATRTLCQFASRLRYEDIPQEAIHQAKRVILDTIGCAIAGFSIDAGKIIVHVMRELGGNPEATVFPTGNLTSAANAAYINSQLANIRDLDDDLMDHGHFSNCTVMASLAVGEQQPASGRDLITAVIAGYEVAARVCLSLSKVAKIVSPPPNLEVIYSPVAGGGYAIFGATASVGRILELADKQMQHALGIAGFTSPIPGYGKIAESLPMFKYCPFGSIAWEAVIACSLAKQGMTGVTTILDGDRGYWRMVGSDYCDWDTLTAGLGDKWWIMDTNFKLLPACNRNRPAILCMQKIIKNNHIRPNEIESITVKTSPQWINPIFCNTRPRNPAEASSSYPWNMAMVALGIPGDKWDTKATLENPQAQAIAQKVKVDVEPKAVVAVYEQLKENQKVRAARRAPTTVDVMARRMVFSEYGEYGKGDPSTEETWISDKELEMKFRTYTRELIPDEHLDWALDLLHHLDEVNDLRKLTPFLVI